MKKFISMSMASVMCFSSVMGIFASEELPQPPGEVEPEVPETTPGPEEKPLEAPSISSGSVNNGDNKIPVTVEVLNQTAPIEKFSVTAPTSLPIVMDLAGNVRTATNAAIKNQSTKSVKVSDIRLSPNKGWDLVDFNAGVSGFDPDSKHLALSINGSKTKEADFAFNKDGFPIIGTESSLPLEYTAKIPRQKKAASVTTAAESVFVIGWADDFGGVKPEAQGTPIVLSRLHKVCKDLTGTITFSREAYTGDPNNVTINLNDDASSVCVVTGNNAVVYGQGGVKAPADSSKMFESYRAKVLDVSGLDTSEVTNMANMFASCRASVISGLNQFDTTQVTNMSYMFSRCSASLDLTSFDTAAVTNMGAMFQGASTTDIKGLTNFNTSSVTNMSGMFSDTSITELDLTHFDTRNVIYMNGMFAGSSVTNLDLSSFNTDKVQRFGSMFKDSNAIFIDMSGFTHNSIVNENGYIKDQHNDINYGYSWMHLMFSGSKASKVLCKDQETLTFFKGSCGNTATGFQIKNAKV